MFKINVLSLKEGEYKSDYAIKPSDLKLDEKIFINVINIDVIVRKNSYQLEIGINFNSKVRLECDRCLDKFNYDCQGKFSLFYKPLLTKTQKINEEQNDDTLRYYLADSKYIDLTNDLRDFIILSIPMRKVPEEIDGVCVKCKRNIDKILNKHEKTDDINPVWDKLLERKNL
jgi:uncharacterized protein